MTIKKSVFGRNIEFMNMKFTYLISCVDKNNLMRSTGTGVSVGTKLIHNRLLEWNFDMRRMIKLGMSLPDPLIQIDVLKTVCEKLMSDPGFNHRFQTYVLTHIREPVVLTVLVQIMLVVYHWSLYALVYHHLADL